ALLPVAETASPAVAAPTAVGEKDTVTGQVALAASVVHPMDTVKAAEPESIAESVPVGVCPMFWSVSCVLPVAPSATGPRACAAGVSVSCEGVGAVPVSVAVAAPPGLAATVSVAGRAPATDVGANATETVQLPPASSVAPRQSPPTV